MTRARVFCRFSCGAPSAVATKLSIAKYGPDAVEIVYCDTRSEHPDNQRFLDDCAVWFGKPVTVVASDEYRDTWDVFARRNMIMSLARGFAPCTAELKRAPFYAQDRQPDDILVFGYTSERSEIARAERLVAANNELFEFPLIDAGLTKSDCKAIVERAGIALPAMYGLGFHNNNCIGCPKGGMGYWNLVRRHFPVQFERMAALQRTLGPNSGFLKRRGERITLDQLDPSDGNHDIEVDIDCSIMCVLAEQEISA